MMQALQWAPRYFSGTAPWQTMTHAACFSMAASITSSWGPQMTMLFAFIPRRTSPPRAMTTSPEIRSKTSSSWLTMWPSSAESRLNTGTSVTLGLRMDSMSFSATPPAVIMP